MFGILRIFSRKKHESSSSTMDYLAHVDASPSIEREKRIEDPYAYLIQLIARMDSAAPLNIQQRERLFRLDLPNVARKMLNDGVTYGVASGGFDFLNQDQDAVKNYIKKIDNDLSELLQIVEQGFDRLHERGEIPAPHYPWRIAVILSREKQKELELLFLRSWCKQVEHLDYLGKRYTDIFTRLQKLESTPTKADE